MFSLLDFAMIPLKKKESVKSVVGPSEFTFVDPFKRIGEGRNESFLMERGGEYPSIPDKRLFKKEETLGYFIYRNEAGEGYAVWPLQLVVPRSAEEGVGEPGSFSSVVRTKERTWPLLL